MTGLVPTRRIPLVVIGGFLGAGKTTLVNRWLGEAGGRAMRLAVLVNDFGALDIDAELVRAAGGNTIALGNGCVCCQIGDDLSAALLQVLERDQRFDAVVVEASGVSDPWRIAQIALAEPSLSLGGVVVVVDASALPQQAQDPLLSDTLERQIDAADLLLVNKVDLVEAPAQAALSQWLRQQAPGVAQLAVRDAALPLTWIDPGLPSRVRARSAVAHDHAHAHDHPHHGEVFEGWSVQPQGVFRAEALRSALACMPEGVLRLKGLLLTDTLGWSEWQFAGRHGSLRRALAEPCAGAGVVAIGLKGRLSGVELEQLMERCQLPMHGTGVPSMASPSRGS